MRSVHGLGVSLTAVLLLLSGCNSGTDPGPSFTSPNYQVVAFSDLHFNPFYDPSLYAKLSAADPSQWAGIFQTSKVTAPSEWNTDTNYPLLELALSGIKQNLGTSPVILYTGDLIGHRIPQLFYQHYYGTSTPPNPPSAAAVAAMQAFTDKTVAFVTSQIRLTAGSLPVIFAIGNIDSYTGYGPDSTFLSHNAETLYTQLVSGVADHQAFLNTFTDGGYYSAQPLGAHLLVLGLNTNPFAQGVPGDNTPAVNTELAWLDSELAAAQSAGQKVWILMHVPPGVNTATTASNVTAPIHLTTAAMQWVSDYQTSFLQILAKYPGVITLNLGAHTHMDEYRILSADSVLQQIPAISPLFGDNPAFKIFTMSPNTFTPTDYKSLSYDLTTLPAQFNGFYTFSTTYAMQGSLQSSLAQLYPQLVSNGTLQGTYRYQYNSGNSSINAATGAAWNPINNSNWPIFACGIGQIDEQAFISCVNSY